MYDTAIFVVVDIQCIYIYKIVSFCHVGNCSHDICIISIFFRVIKVLEWEWIFSIPGLPKLFISLEMAQMKKKLRKMIISCCMCIHVLSSMRQIIIFYFLFHETFCGINHLLPIMSYQ